MLNIFDLDHDNKMSKLERRLQKIVTEVVRALFILGFGILMMCVNLTSDPTLHVFFTMMGASIIAFWFVHVLIKIMFPYIDKRTLVKNAITEAHSSAIVIQALCILAGLIFIAFAIAIK